MLINNSSQSRRPAWAASRCAVLVSAAVWWWASCAQEGSESDDSLVLATVNEKAISLADLRKSIQRMVPEEQQRVQPEQYLQGLIDEEVMAQEAERRGLNHSPDMQGAMDMEARGLTIRELFRREGMALVPPTEEEMRAYFEDSPLRRQVRFSALMVDSSEQIPAILQQLESGADFETVSKRYTRDRRILDRDADMGYHRWGDTAPAYVPLSDKAFSMEEGEIAGPLHVADGYFLIKVTDVRSVPFEEERQTIARQLGEDILRHQLVPYYNRLVNDYDLKIEEAGFAALAREMVDPSAARAAHHQGHHSAGHGTHQAADQKMGAAKAASASPDLVAVVTMRDDTLSLRQCRIGLAEAGMTAFADADVLRKRLIQQVCREVLVLREIKRLGISDAPAIQDRLRRARRRHLASLVHKRLSTQIPRPSDSELRLYYAQMEPPHPDSLAPFDEIRERVLSDYLEQRGLEAFRVGLKALRKQHDITLYDERIARMARLWREGTL